jgi:glycine cleavage system H protein
MKFTESHEWISVDADIGTIGITKQAQEELGEIVHVELPTLGKFVKAGEEVAVLESTKAAADIYAPVSGEIVAINQGVSDLIDKINTRSESEGWLFKIKVSHPAELQQLMDREQYLALIQT